MALFSKTLTLRRVFLKLESILSCYFLIRSPHYRNLRLKFVGIANKTNELTAMEKDGIYEKAMVDRFLEDARKSEIFFDIGGNIGNYSLVYRKISEGTCHCWEPETKYMFLHRINQLLNFKNWRKIHFYKKFVGVDDDNNTVSLNKFCDVNNIFPDLVKIDVEGAEAKILPSLKNMFFKNNPKIYLEYHPVDIKNVFKICPASFIDFVCKNFSEVELNINHWGSFKGVPPGAWVETSKDELLKLTEEILAGERKPRGFGLILSGKLP